MKFILLIGTIIMHLNLFCQEKGDLSFKFSVSEQNIDLQEINEVILDEDKVVFGNIKMPRTDSFKSGLKLSGSLGYQITPFWEIGARSSFQSSSCEHFDGYTITNDGVPDTLFTRVKYLASSISFGIFSRYNVSRVLGLDSKKGILGRTLIGVNLYSGYSRFNFTETDFFFSLEDDAVISSQFGQYYGSANAIHLDFSLDVGILLLKGNLISSIGLEFGYQSLVGGNLSNRNGVSFLNTGENRKMDMSGLYFGGFIKIGK